MPARQHLPTELCTLALLFFLARNSSSSLACLIPSWLTTLSLLQTCSPPQMASAPKMHCSGGLSGTTQDPSLTLRLPRQLLLRQFCFSPFSIPCHPQHPKGSLPLGTTICLHRGPCAHALLTLGSLFSSCPSSKSLMQQAPSQNPSVSLT